MPRNKTQLKYIQIYNQILKQIHDGFYPEGSKLPTENEMAEALNASRMTVRQALLLLKEDGILETKQGSGNYVKKHLNQNEVGFETKGNPILKMIHEPLNIEYQYGSGRPNEYIKTIFGPTESNVIDIHRYYKNNEGNTMAYSFSLTLEENIQSLGLDLNQSKDYQQLLDQTLYSQLYRIRMEFKIVPEDMATRIGHLKSESNYFIAILESVYDHRGKLILHTKHFAPAENVSFLMNWYNQ